MVALYGVGHQRSADFVRAVGGGGVQGVDERERREVERSERDGGGSVADPGSGAFLTPGSGIRDG